MSEAIAHPKSHVRAWYSYAFAAEVFSAVGIAIFLPITLEKMARDIGYFSPDHSVRCEDVGDEGIDRGRCEARIMGVWVDTASFSMYVKSIAVLAQVLCIVSLGPLADSSHWRKRLLVIAAYAGSITCSLILLFPSAPHSFTPILTAVLTIIGNAAYGTSIVCANAFLPGLAREDPAVQAAFHALPEAEDESDLELVISRTSLNLEDEGRRLLPSPIPEVAASVISAISTAELADAPISPNADTAQAHYHALLSITTSRISSVATALGFLSGVSVLALLIVPVTLMGGTTSSLRLAVGVSAIWWAIFTIPAWRGLPGGSKTKSSHHGGNGIGLGQGWKRVGGMIKPSKIRQLPNLFTFLLAWIFLSDGFHTTTYTAILYASSTLKMSPSKIIIIGVLVQLAAVISSILAPKVQKRLAISNQRLLLWVILLAEIIPIYACIGLILPFGGLRTEGEMYVAATWFGLLYGPFQSYSRAVYAELIPPNHESSFFSLFALTDKSASFVGPAIVGLISDITGNIRNGFIFLLIMLAVPIPVLLRVRAKRGKEEAIEWSNTKARDTRRPRLYD